MKKFLFFIVLGIGTLFSLSSCVTPAYSQDVVVTDDNVDINIVVRYGTPYYYEGSLLYILYNGYYYYPRYISNNWRYYRYSRPLPPPRRHDIHHGGYHPRHDVHHGGHHSSTYRTPPPPRRNPNSGINHRPPQNRGGFSGRPQNHGGMHHGGARMGGRR